jgi:hypothetical protein
MFSLPLSDPRSSLGSRSSAGLAKAVLLVGWLAVAGTGATLSDLGAQTPNLPRLSGPVLLDGNPSDPAWTDVEPVSLSMYEPESGGQPS